MSVSLREVIEAAGYNLTDSYEDAMWLLSKQEEFTELVEKADELLEDKEDE